MVFRNGVYHPINLHEIRSKDDNDGEFLLRLSIWTIRALKKLRNSVPDKKISYIESSLDEGQSSFLDFLWTLYRFSIDNSDYFSFISRYMRNGGESINWQRTINETTPLIRSGIPYYFDVISSRRIRDFDAELFVIFFSILMHINEAYGFSCVIPEGYNLLDKLEFDRYLRGRGKSRLIEIRYKYFSDRDLRIWELSYLFFDHSERFHASKSMSDEYLLASDFQNVFERMVNDTLQQSPSIEKLKDLYGGSQRIDHLYRGRSLFQTGKDVFYIADSKYYASDGEIGQDSIDKQYSYVAGITKACLDHKFHVKDDVTRGYDFIPNYLISAYIDMNIPNVLANFDNQEVVFSWRKESTWHFENCFFDRSSLHLFKFRINFASFLKDYCESEKYVGNLIKAKVRSTIIEELENKFKFLYLELTQLQDVSNLVNLNWIDKGTTCNLDGKLYGIIDSGKMTIILALKDDSTVSDIKSHITSAGFTGWKDFHLVR